MRGGSSDKPILGGMRTEPLLENGERMGYKVIDIVTGEEGTIAHKNIDSRLRVLSYGIDIEELNRVAIPAIDYAQHHCEVLVIDEIGKFSVESEAFVQAVRSALEVALAALMTHESATPRRARHMKVCEIMMFERLNIRPACSLPLFISFHPYPNCADTARNRTAAPLRRHVVSHSSIPLCPQQQQVRRNRPCRQAARRPVSCDWRGPPQS